LAEDTVLAIASRTFMLAPPARLFAIPFAQRKRVAKVDIKITILGRLPEYG
jgi:hypothetical protein